MIAAWGSSEDELMQEYKDIQRASREKKRNSNVVGMQRKALVLDANILIRAVLGLRVRRMRGAEQWERLDGLSV